MEHLFKYKTDTVKVGNCLNNIMGSNVKKERNTESKTLEHLFYDKIEIVTLTINNGTMFFGVFGFPCPVESVLWGYSKQDWVVCFIVQLILKLTRKLFCLPPASETPHYGSYQAHYIWAGASGPLLPRGPVTNHRVSFFTQVLFQQDTCSCFIWSFCCKYLTGLKSFCGFFC